MRVEKDLTAFQPPDIKPPDKKRLAYLAGFYIGIPVFWALMSGASESGSATFVSKQYYFLYFLAASLPLWWLSDLTTRIVKTVLAPWRPPMLLVFILGAILAANAQAVLAPIRQSAFEPYLAEGSAFYQIFPWRYGDPDYLMEALVAWTVGGAIWSGANMFYIYMLNIPRYGYAASRKPSGPPETAEAEMGPASVPETSASAALVLLDKLPAGIGTTVVALKAEEHYTRVFTDQGEALVLIRFGDAVRALGDVQGLQTHRSYWVNRAFIETLNKKGRTAHIRLTTGLEAPVSRSYRVNVEEALQAK